MTWPVALVVVPLACILLAGLAVQALTWRERRTWHHHWQPISGRVVMRKREGGHWVYREPTAEELRTYDDMIAW